MKELAPIVLFVYNRLGHTMKTVEALKMNFLAPHSRLFIFADGAKDNNSVIGVKNVRTYLKKIDGFKSIKIIERNKNWGLASSIIDGVTKIINEYGKIIVIEDDLVTSPYFLSYMNDALITYKNDDQVSCIHGYLYPVDEISDPTFFIKGADCWGWATWKKSWIIFEPNGLKLMREIDRRQCHRQIDFNNTYSYVKMLKDHNNGKIDSWAIRWYVSTFLSDKLTLYPNKSFVLNIGMDDSGTHSGISNKFHVKLADSYQKLERIEIVENLEARKKFEKLFSSYEFGIIPKVLNKVRQLTIRNLRNIFK